MVHKSQPAMYPEVQCYNWIMQIPLDSQHNKKKKWRGVKCIRSMLFKKNQLLMDKTYSEPTNETDCTCYNSQCYMPQNAT